MKEMKRILVFALLALAVAAAAQAGAPAESAKLAELSQKFVDAWNQHDAKAMASVWAPDGDLINPFGRVARGRGEVEKLFADEHSTFLKQSTFKLLDRTTRSLDPDAVIDDWDVEVAGIEGPDGPMPPLKHHITVVYQKKGGQWWVAAVRPVVYSPPPGAPAAKP